ncbi:MAG: hypothetical protein ACRDYZ_16805 [Acidimicrobiales bacterium]
MPLAIVVLLGVAVVAFVVLGSRGPSGTASQQMTSWVRAANLGQAIGVLTDDDRNIARAVAAHQDTTAIHTVCAVLSNEAQTANQNLPSPNVHVTDTLARAFSLEYDAAQACYKGGAKGKQLLAESARDRSKALTLLHRVLADVRHITGQSVPTTTTTTPAGPTGTIL